MRSKDAVEENERVVLLVLAGLKSKGGYPNIRSQEATIYVQPRQHILSRITQRMDDVLLGQTERPRKTLTISSQIRRRFFVIRLQSKRLVFAELDKVAVKGLT